MDVRGIIQKAKQAGFLGVIARCGDCDQLWNKDLSPFDVGNYVDPSFTDAVDEAHKQGMLLIALYRLGMVPNRHYPPNRPTPIECFQTNTILHATKFKTFHGIAITIPHASNTDTNMMTMLNDLFYVFNKRGITKPVIVGTTPAVWGYGSKALENTIGQENYPHIVWNMNPKDYKVPGLLPTSNRFMWSYGYTLGSTATAWIGSLGGLFERFGEPANYDTSTPPVDPPVDPPAEDPADPPVDPPVVDGDIAQAIREAGNTIAQAIRELK